MTGQRKTLRQHFCEGIEAAVKAEPVAFKSTKPRTNLGLMVRELVIAATSAKTPAIKSVMAYLDEAEVRRRAAEIDGEEIAERLPEPKWDWSEDGVWDSSERTEEYLKEQEQKKQDEEARDGRLAEMKAEVREKFIRAAEADRLNDERKAGLEAERQGLDPPSPAPAPPAAPTLRNNPPPPDPNRRTIRIGGRIVEG